MQSLQPYRWSGHMETFSKQSRAKCTIQNGLHLAVCRKSVVSVLCGSWLLLWSPLTRPSPGWNRAKLRCHCNSLKVEHGRSTWNLRSNRIDIDSTGIDWRFLTQVDKGTIGRMTDAFKARFILQDGVSSRAGSHCIWQHCMQGFSTRDWINASYS